MTYVLGLTGSIGTGKSTTAQMFRDAGIPVWDADAAVHDLYAEGGGANRAIARAYPDAMDGGAVSRAKLRALIAGSPEVLDDIQGIVHPLVAADRAAFLARTDAPIVVLDIPLLFETGAERVCDGIVVVTVAPDEQRRRVLARGEMTDAEFKMILARQIPDVEKRARATWVIETDTLDGARAAVANVLQDIAKEQARA